MDRLSKFSSNRIVGRRDLMVAYDCDDPGALAALSEAVACLDLDGRDLLQGFAPDSPIEARNRGFRPYRG